MEREVNKFGQTEQERKDIQNVTTMVREGYTQAAMTMMLEMIHNLNRRIEDLEGKEKKN